MCLVNDEQDLAVALGGLGGEQVLGLGHELGAQVARLGPERAHDRDVEAAGAEGRVGDVDDLVAGGVERGDGGAQGDRLAGADVAGDHAECGFDDAEVDAGDGLLVGRAREEITGGDRLAEGRAGEAEVSDPGRRAHGVGSWSAEPKRSSWEKSSGVPVPAAASWAACTSPR